MQAIIHDHYGPPEGLQLRDIPTPVIKADELLVRVRAAGLQIGDLFLVRGAPFPVRAMSGLFRPTYGVPGFDLAGIVEAVGGKVKSFKPGDEVFGCCNGSCAELARTSPDRLALKPTNLTFEQAAAVPTSAIAALRGLRDVGGVQPGHQILINGASGGVGTFAVQIAKALGAEVTGVCSSSNLDLVRSIGADHVIDYTNEDFTVGGARFDVILDNVENHSLGHTRRVLTPRGTLVLNSGTGAKGFVMMRRLFAPMVLAPFVSQKLRRYVVAPKQRDLIAVKEMVEAGRLTPVIDKVYSLRDTPAALAQVEAGHARGKVVVALTLQ